MTSSSAGSPAVPCLLTLPAAAGTAVPGPAVSAVTPALASSMPSAFATGAP